MLQELSTDLITLTDDDLTAILGGGGGDEAGPAGEGEPDSP